MSPQKKKIDTMAVVVLVIMVAAVGLYIYGRVFHEATPGDYHVRKGNYRLEDGQFLKAEEEFKLALDQNPEHKMAHFGLALAYIQMEQYDKAMEKIETVLKMDPEMAWAYANRGILHDRTGRYRMALADYQKALELDPEVAKGPGVLWRFLRNVAEKPPTIADRARYIEEQLALPPEERVLSIPELDEEQRMYKKKG